MGIFSGKTKTYVSSVVYNMAGDEFKRPNFLKTTVLGAITGDSPSVANSITHSYLNGPRMRFRSFKRWTERNNYNDVIGLVSGSIATGNRLSYPPIQDAIEPSVPGAIVRLQTAVIGEADYTYWADQWVAENHPEQLMTEYTADYDATTNVIRIIWEDTTFEDITPIGFDLEKRYIYATYVEYVGEHLQDLIEGDEVTLDPGDPFPDTAGWTEVFFEDDGAGTTHGLWSKTTFMGNVPGENATYSVTEYMYQDEVAGVRTYQIDTQDTWHSAAGPLLVFIYGEGGSNAELNEMFLPNQNVDGFYPIIPVRAEAKFLSEKYLPETFKLAKRAYNRATTGHFHQLVDDLKLNPDLDDIDYTYTVFGVCLNVLEQQSRKYIFRFFEEVMNDYGGVSEAEYAVFQAEWAAAQASQETWMDWREAQADSGNPLYGTPEPTRLGYPTMPGSSFEISTPGNKPINYKVVLKWDTITYLEGTGRLKPDAVADQLWFTKGDLTVYHQEVWTDDPEGGFGRMPMPIHYSEELFLNWQVTDNTWKRIRLRGLLYKNYVYNGKSVDISGFEALDDPEESGFIVPLHDGIFREMGMRDGTQMTTACCFLVFNCYTVVKQKWYQTGAFKIVLIIIIIVIAYFTGGASLGATSGVLGTNAAVGAAIIGAGAGVAITAIVGAIANAIAAMLITKLITMAATELFGEKWGAIIGAIASVIALNVGSAMASGQTMANSFSGLMRADNILRLTEAAGRGYSQYIQASNADIMAEQQNVLDTYKQESREVREAFEANLGGGNGVVDPLAITNAMGVTVESMDSFLQRTLLTGSDVADMSMEMLNNFVAMTLNTDLPT